MSSLPQEILDAVDQIATDKFNSLVNSGKIDPTAISTSLHQFQKENMILSDGDEPIPHYLFRKFLEWYRIYYTYNVNNNEAPALASARYMTPVDVPNPPDCGKIIAPFANLDVSGADVLPQMPDPATSTPDQAGFTKATDLMLAGMGQNITDNKWYYRGISTQAYYEKYGKKYNWYASRKKESTPIVKYGYIYNWYAATDARNIAPVGWRVPTQSDFDTLYTYLGGAAIAGKHLKEIGNIYWDLPNTGDNSSGFNGRGGGTRANGFYGIKQVAYYWVTDGVSGGNGQTFYIYPGGNDIGQTPTAKYLAGQLRLVGGNTDTITGNDGKVYKTVVIGTQRWMAEDLCETKYRNGDSIPEETNDAAWDALITGARCSYNNEEDNAFTLGDDAHDLAPAGYHLPTLAEMNTLRTTIGGDTAGGKLKETGTTHWLLPNTGATDEYLLKLIGSGIRDGATGEFTQLKRLASHWTSNEQDLTTATHWYVSYMSDLFSPASMHYEGQLKSSGLAVRFIKDDSTNDDSVMDIDGNVYPTVKIGTLVIMAENFRCTHYNDGSVIPEITDNTLWVNDTEGAICDYLLQAGSSVEGIYNIKDVLSLEIGDITSLDEDLTNLQDVLDILENGLSDNNFTNALKAEYDAAVVHMSEIDIHLAPDEVTISGVGNVLSLISAYLIALFSADSPLALDNSGKLSLEYDDTQFDVVDGKLTIITPAEAPDALLSFDEATSILTVDPLAGDASVDLSSLAPGAGVDLTNFLKKTGASTQTVDGDIIVTGKLRSYV